MHSMAKEQSGASMTVTCSSSSVRTFFNAALIRAWSSAIRTLRAGAVNAVASVALSIGIDVVTRYACSGLAMFLTCWRPMSW